MLDPSDYYMNSDKVNSPIFEIRVEPEEDSKEIGNGPPSFYDDPPEDRKERSKKDMMRQGPNPEVDIYEKDYLPVTNTLIEPPKQNAQGELSDNTTPDGRNEDFDTIGFDPGTLIERDEAI